MNMPGSNPSDGQVPANAKPVWTYLADRPTIGAFKPHSTTPQTAILQHPILVPGEAAVQSRHPKRPWVGRGEVLKWLGLRDATLSWPIVKASGKVSC